MANLIFVLVSAALQIYQMNEVQLETYLTDLKSRGPSLDARIIDTARRGLGTPYFNGPLGEGPDGKYDQDPLIDLTRVDCVTYIEQTLALAACDSYEAAFATLQRIRYREGKIGFETRNHFMVGDWVVNNIFCRNMSEKLGVDTEEVTRTISKREYFPKVNAPGLGASTPDQLISLKYVPSEAAAEAAAHIPSPSIIVFIGKIDWLFALHCGLAIRDETGALKLFHASSKMERVVCQDFVEYVSAQESRYIGFTVYAIGSEILSKKASE